MSRNRLNYVVLFSVIMLFAVVLVWLRTPAQRLSALERRDYTHATERARQIVVDQALGIAGQDRRAQIQKRVARLVFDVQHIEPEADYRRTLVAGRGYDEVLREMVRLAMEEGRAAPDIHFIYLAGQLEERSVIPRLRELSHLSIPLPKQFHPDPTELTNSSQWAANQALARMGDKQAIQISIAHVLAIRCATSRSWWELQALDYIRQPEAVALFQHYLFDNQGFEGWPIKPEKEEVYRILYGSVVGWPRCDPYVPLPTPPPVTPQDMAVEKMQMRRPPTPQEIADRKRRIDACTDEARVWVKTQETLRIKQ